MMIVLDFVSKFYASLCLFWYNPMRIIIITLKLVQRKEDTVDHK
jgi:hypothetical protein